MRRAIYMVMCLAGTAHAQEATTEQEPPDASRWDLAVAAGVSNESMAVPGMQLMGGTTARTTTMPGVDQVSDVEPSALFALRYRVTERVLWSVPTLSFAYLGGTAGTRELIPWAGLTSWGAGYSSIEHFIAAGQLGAGAAAREWLNADTAINVTAGAASAFHYRSARLCDAAQMCQPTWQGPTRWVASATAGVSQRIGALTINVGAGVARAVETDGDTGGTIVSFGSIQDVALRRLPLVQAELSPKWSLDGYASASYDLARDGFEQRYLVGFTRTWAP